MTTNDDDYYVSCFDNPRTELHYENAVTWFLNRFAADSNETIQSEEPFDVIIMDAL